MVESIFSARRKKKLLSLLIVLLLFLSIFHFSAFTHIFNSSESKEVLVLSVNPPDYIEYMTNYYIQSTGGLTQIKKVIKSETISSLQLLFFGKARIENHESKNQNSETPTNRSIIHQTIEQSPGITLREIQRVTGLAIGVIQYHLNHLEAAGIETLRLGRCKHFFSGQGHFSLKEKKWFAVTQNKNVRTILLFLRSNGNKGFQKDIVNFAGISKVMVSYYVKQLEQLGIINRNHHRLQITEDYLYIMNKVVNLKN